MDYRAYHSLILFSLFFSALSTCAFAMLASIPRSRNQGVVGLVGSVTLGLGIFSGQVFHNLGAMVSLEAVGALLLFLSSLMAVKRRYT